MYTRNYTDEERTLRIPEGYDGTALSEPPREQQIPQGVPEVPREIKISPREEEAASVCSEPQNEKRTDITRLPLFVRRMLPLDLNFGLPTIGTEELLIVAVALCVIFSDEVDILCALMLIALIFIT